MQNSLEKLERLGTVMLQCVKPIEISKTAICSAGQNYPALVGSSYFGKNLQLLVIDDEDKVRIITGHLIDHFSLEPVPSSTDLSVEHVRLQEGAHKDWCSAIEFMMGDEEFIFNPKDIVYWKDGCKDIASQIDYDTPIYIQKIFQEEKVARVICQLQPLSDEGSENYIPLQSPSFVVETIPLFRLRKSYY